MKRITKKKGLWIFQTDQDYIFNFEFSSVTGTYHHPDFELSHNRLKVKKGYKWDGCTPKFLVGDLVFGTPDGMRDLNTGLQKTYLASLAHDVLYEYSALNLVSRKDADRIFLHEMQKASFKLAKMYFFGVRLMGRFYWRGDK